MLKKQIHILLSGAGSLLILLALLGVLHTPATQAAPGAAITVTTLNDTGAGSLRQAIADANSGDTIDFSVSSTITLTSQLVITGNNNLTINGGSAITVSGNNAARVFKVANSNVTFNDLVIANGNRQFSGDDPDCFIGACGGGIAIISSTVAINNSAVRDNTAVSTSPFTADKGGGIFVDTTSTLTVTNSTISNNTAENGGGIYIAAGTVTIDNSTISGNAATNGRGGGIDSQAGNTTISNSTITGNAVTWSGSDGGCGISSYGGSTSTTLSNTIVSGNSCSGDAHDADYGIVDSFHSNGNNLIGTTNSSAFNQSGDQTNVTNPMLDPLADNGGNTQTHALQTGSPAIDVGANCGAADQRGVSRPQDGNNDGSAVCDIGAFELAFYDLTVNVAGTGGGAVSSSPSGISCGGDCTETYRESTVVTLTATTSAGYFAGWSGACSGTGDCVVTMDNAKNVTSTFMLYTSFMPVVAR